MEPTFAEIPLLADAAPCSGVAFELQDPAREPEVVDVEGWQAEVRTGQPTVVVRGGSEDNHDDATRAGLAAAQQALDLMSMRGGNNLMIKAFDDEYIVWWVEAGEIAIRIVSLARLGINVSPVTLTVTDEEGNIVPTDPTPEVQWHESFRYFRLSQTTDDLFDAYRNAYLALESVLSSIAPQLTDAAGKPTEREGEWFKRALSQANSAVALASHASAGAVDPVQELYDELYVGMRSAMSHAKSGRKVLLPQDEGERVDVTASLRRLVGLYLELADAYLGARRLGGGITLEGFDKGIAPMLANVATYVSDDESPVDKSEASPNPGGGAMMPLSPIGEVDASRPFLATRLWSAPGATVSELPFVRRVVGTIEDTASLVTVLNGRLVVESPRRVEVMLGIKASNTRQPRDQYSY